MSEDLTAAQHVNRAIEFQSAAIAILREAREPKRMPLAGQKMTVAMAHLAVTQSIADSLIAIASFLEEMTPPPTVA